MGAKIYNYYNSNYLKLNSETPFYGLSIRRSRNEIVL